jgi:hypothetical protein
MPSIGLLWIRSIFFLKNFGLTFFSSKFFKKCILIYNYLLLFGSIGSIVVQPVEPIEPQTSDHAGSISGSVFKTLSWSG